MPELPEVETTRRALEPYLLNRTILGLHHSDPGKYRNTLDAIGRRITSLERRGKYLIFRLEAGNRTGLENAGLENTGLEDTGLEDTGLEDTGLDVIVHLKMTGGFRFPESGTHFLEAPRFERLRLETDAGEVSYVDARRFGFWEVVPRNAWTHIASLANMGPEPLEDGFKLEPFALAMSKVSRVKPALLSQKPVAGVGNIYADESLWTSKIHPEAGKLSKAQSKRLHSAIRTVMARAVKAGGSTLSDNSYQQPDGNPGYFQLEHAVYDRANQPCKRCGTPIEKYWLAGRGTHFCPQCQKL